MNELINIIKETILNLSYDMNGLIFSARSESSGLNSIISSMDKPSSSWGKRAISLFHEDKSQAFYLSYFSLV